MKLDRQLTSALILFRSSALVVRSLLVPRSTVHLFSAHPSPRSPKRTKSVLASKWLLRPTPTATTNRPRSSRLCRPPTSTRPPFCPTSLASPRPQHRRRAAPSKLIKWVVACSVYFVWPILGNAWFGSEMRQLFLVYHRCCPQLILATNAILSGGFWRLLCD